MQKLIMTIDEKIRDLQYDIKKAAKISVLSS